MRDLRSHGARIPPRAWTLAGLLLVSGLGCASAPDYRDAPEWLSVLPRDDDWLYAVGAYVGSLDPNDNHKNALQAAAERLAQAFSSQVTSRSEVHTTTSGMSARGISRVDTATVLRQMEHIATWVDVDGSYGRRGTVWVLVRAPIELNLGG